MSTTTLEPYAVVAYNSAWDSENKIHDDEVARRFGFSGGLVPGVDVYAYMAHAPVARCSSRAAPWRHASTNPSTRARPRRWPPRRQMAVSTSR